MAYRFLINQPLCDTLNIGISCSLQPSVHYTPPSHKTPGLYNNWFSMRIISPPQHINGGDTLLWPDLSVPPPYITPSMRSHRFLSILFNAFPLCMSECFKNLPSTPASVLLYVLSSTLNADGADNHRVNCISERQIEQELMDRPVSS